MSIIDFVKKIPEKTNSKFPKLISEEPNLWSVNEEFNQYLEYYIAKIQLSSRGHVLIVEDDLFGRKIVENAIHQFSDRLKIYATDSSKSALALMKSVPMELVLADYFLKGKETGLDLCRKIHELYPATKCVMMSQMRYWQYQQVVSEDPLGGKSTPEFIEKPVSPTLLKRYLTSFFEETVK